MEISPETAQLVKEYLRRGGRQAQNELSMLVEQDPELRDALSQLWTADERMAQQSGILERGQKASDAAMPGGRTVRNGIFIKSDPSESIRAAFKQGVGGIEEQQAQQQMADILREKGDTNQAFNKFKQGQAANALRTMTQDRAAEDAKKAQGELIPGALEEMNYAPGGTPVNRMPFQDRAPGIAEVGPLGLGPTAPAQMTDQSPQRGRGYGALGAVPGTPGAGPNVGVAPVPKAAFPKPAVSLTPAQVAENRIKSMIQQMHPEPFDPSNMLVRGGG